MLKDYQMFCVSVQGASHIQAGTPKEDDAGLRKDDLGWIGVVSDGHGDPRCMRSSIGSAVAVQTAIDCLHAWLEEQRPAPAEPGENAAAPMEAETEEPAALSADPDARPTEDGGSPAETADEPHAEAAPEPQEETAGEAAEETGEKAAEAPEGEPGEKSGEEPAEAAEKAPEPAAAPCPCAEKEDPWSERRIRRLCRDIAVRWQAAVTGHYDANPLTEEEVKAAGNLYQTYAAGKRISHIYGATLLAAVMTDDRMLLIQKGDGHAVFVYENGVTSHEVIPWDERCVLNYTTSLCDTDAADTFTYTIVDMTKKPAVAAVFLASDGLEDCFPDMGPADVFVGQTAIFGAKEGMENLEEYLRSELSGMSDRASRDDISVVGWINPPAVSPLKRRFDLLSEYYQAHLRMKEAQLHIGSMSGSRQRLEDRLQKMEAQLAEMKARQEKVAAARRALAEQEEAEKARIQEDPVMQRTQGLMAEFIQTMGLRIGTLAERMKNFGAILESVDRSRTEAESLARQEEELSREISDLQAEYDELREKFTGYTARYQHWADQRSEAEHALERINADLTAPAQPEPEAEDAEAAFMRMMEE